MTDITDPLQTIISILKNSSIGIGTSGYEITDDNGQGLTISGGNLLVTYILGQEELKVLFGGDQDFDVIFTVKKEEISDIWIGLDTKEYKVAIIITINVVDKWSDIGSGKKYITAPLVLDKALNALRKFIMGKTSSAGGSINKWEIVGVRNEQDTSTLPVLYKCIVETETISYYI